MPSPAKRIVTEWVYRVDVTQLKAAQKEVTKLTGKLNAAHQSSARLFNLESKNIAALITQYNLLTAAVGRYATTRNLALGGGAMVPFAGGMMPPINPAIMAAMGMGGKGGGGGGGTKAGGGGAAGRAARAGFFARNFGFRGRGGVGHPATTLRSGAGGASLLGYGLLGLGAVGAFQGLKTTLGAGSDFELTKMNFERLLKGDGTIGLPSTQETCAS